MLQFIAETNEQYSIPELAQMAIEGGCKWIQLRVPDLSDDEIRELATELVPLCKETTTILTIENHAQMAKELGIHGVHLRGGDRSAAAVREEFGPEAIIGVEVEQPSSALALKGLDIDYVTFAAGMPLERVKECVETLRQSGFELPIVAEGEFSPQGAIEAMHTGINGIAESRPISVADDPVAMTESVIQALEQAATTAR